MPVGTFINTVAVQVLPLLLYGLSLNSWLAYLIVCYYVSHAGHISCEFLIIFLFDALFRAK